jgi:hypothetical protein
MAVLTLGVAGFEAAAPASAASGTIYLPHNGTLVCTEETNQSTWTLTIPAANYKKTYTFKNLACPF